LYNDWYRDAAFLSLSQPYLSINIELVHNENHRPDDYD
jgi:hypothetical protein